MPAPSPVVAPSSLANDRAAGREPVVLLEGHRKRDEAQTSPEPGAQRRPLHSTDSKASAFDRLVGDAQRRAELSRAAWSAAHDKEAAPGRSKGLSAEASKTTRGPVSRAGSSQLSAASGASAAPPKVSVNLDAAAGRGVAGDGYPQTSQSPMGRLDATVRKWAAHTDVRLESER